MKPIHFEESNKDLLKPKGMTDKECGSLPVYTDGVTCISCWKASLLDRIKLLFCGKVWLGVMSGETQPPVWLKIEKTAFIK